MCHSVSWSCIHVAALAVVDLLQETRIVHAHCERGVNGEGVGVSECGKMRNERGDLDKHPLLIQSPYTCVPRSYKFKGMLLGDTTYLFPYLLCLLSNIFYRIII